MRKTLAIGSVVLALAGCKKDDDKAKAADQPEGKAKPTAKDEPAKPVGRYKGVTPMPMPAAVTLTPEEKALVDELAKHGTAGMVQYGVPRGGYPEAFEAQLKANPKLLLALMQRSERELQIAAGQEIFDLQAFGDNLLVPPPEHKAFVFALMTSKDEAVAASVTQSAHGGVRGEKADADIQKMLEQICVDDVRPSVRAAACSGVVDHLNAHFGNVPTAQAVAAKALGDESPYVVFRTLDILTSMSWDAQYLDTVIPLLAHAEPAIRGRAAWLVDRTMAHDNNIVPEAETKGQAALVPLLADADPSVRCAAASTLGSWAFRAHWEDVDKLVALLDDTANPETKLAYQSLSLDGPKDDTWTVRGPKESVAECALQALLAKASGAPGDAAMQFSDWQNLMTAGRKAFTDWWAAHKDALLAAKPG